MSSLRFGLLLLAMILLVLACALLAGCDQAAPPVMPLPAEPLDIAPADRHGNYAHGSCLWAACEDVLVLQGRPDEAAYWRAHYSGAATIPPGSPIASVVEAARARGLLYTCTAVGDADFLDYCDRLRLGAAIYWTQPTRRRTAAGNHAITFVRWDGDRAVLIDNNRPSRELLMPRDELLAKWRAAGGGGFSFCLSAEFKAAAQNTHPLTR
jgi:hypothetical protein